jgi:hypothetical protein
VISKEDVVGYLRIAASGVKEGANLFLAQPALSQAMRIAGGLLDVAVGLLERGVEPVEHITRLIDLDAQLNQARADVDAEAALDG